MTVALRGPATAYENHLSSGSSSVSAVLQPPAARSARAMGAGDDTLDEFDVDE